MDAAKFAHELQDLIQKGTALAPRGGDSFSGYNGREQPEYGAWRFQAITLIEELGKPAARLLKEIEADKQGSYFYQSSVLLILGTLKAALSISQRTLGQQTSGSSDISNPLRAIPSRTDGKIFLGHGRSQVWRDLKDFIQDRLKLIPDEYDLQPSAGMAISERLQQMLDEACFAFIIMTGEDEHNDTSLHARENVIHEVGLFQGRLGFKRAIVLLEDGCKEFSNIYGLSQIRFPMGNIKAKLEDIRRVLEREKIVK